MENQQNSLLSWVYQCQGKTMEELRHSLLYTTLELEQTRMVVQEELKMREDQIMQLRDLLNKAMKERDEAQERCQRLVLEKSLLLQKQRRQRQQQRKEQLVASVNEEQQDLPRRGNDSNNNGFSSSDGEESIVSSCEPPKQIQQPPWMQCASTPEMEKIELGFPEKPLPEKGKLLQAVMKAGPLLQTLLLAGPLPQWRHPPPQLESVEIPPVITPPTPKLQLLRHDSLVINSCGNLNRKRVLCSESNSPSETKYQRVVFP